MIALVSIGLFLVRWRFYPLFNGPLGSQSLELSLDGFTITDDNQQQRFFPLETLRFISETERHMFFYFGSKDGFPLPKSAFENETFAEQIFTLLVKQKDKNLPGVLKEMLEDDDRS